MLRLLFLSLLFAGAACGGDPQPSKDSAPRDPGATLYAAQGCVQCHGPAGEGVVRLGPSLRGLSAHWDAESLAKFLANPAKVMAGDPRLQAQRKASMMDMKAYSNLSKQERLTLAAYLLARQ